MDRLPTEILHQICTYLEKDADLKTFRLLFPRCAAVGLQYLLPVLHITYLPESVEKFKNVSRNPRMRRHVRELFFEPSLFHEYTDFSEYHDAVRKTGWISVFCHACDGDPKEAEIQEGWKLYKDAFRAQQGLYKALQKPGAFKAALRRFPNLHVVRIQTASEFGASFTRWDRARMTPNKHFRKYLIAPKLIASFEEQDHGVVSFIRDIASLNLRLDELYIGHISWRLLKTKSPLWRNFLRVARNLKKLKVHFLVSDPGRHADRDMAELEVNAFESWRHEQDQGQSDRLNKLLESAPKLEVLELSFDVHHMGYDGSKQLGWLSSCLITHPPANLRDLSLHHITTSVSALQQMLRSCAGSLRSLALAHVHLVDHDGWTTVISEMPRILRLDHIRLGHNLSEGILGLEEDDMPFSFESNSEREPGSHRIGHEIQSLILKTDSAMLEQTCVEIRILLEQLKEVLAEEHDEMQEQMEALMFGGPMGDLVYESDEWDEENDWEEYDSGDSQVDDDDEDESANE